ncbi:Rsm22-domain-containing protein [Whalleya microplaca]|nr:Rsm22-domain-containing protein [Whalleya microplaca]
MLSASKAQRSCPQCRLQLLTLFEGGFASPRAELRSLSRPTASSIRVFRTNRKGNARLFSTTRAKSQDVQPESQPPKGEDIEVIVRQAKHAFGSTLPKGYLNEKEYQLYERLYGAPLRETRPEDVGMPIPDELVDDVQESTKRILLRETDDGQLEEVYYEAQVSVSETTEVPPEAFPEGIPQPQELPSDAGLQHIGAVAKSQREYDALLQLQKDFEKSNLQPAEEEEIEEDEEEEEEEDEYDEEDEDEDEEPDAMFRPSFDRVHHHTRSGHWRTNPTTLQLPKADFVLPIAKLLGRTDTKHIKEASERIFGGAALPHSVATPESKRNAEQKPVAMEASNHKLSEIDADAYMAANMPGMYASVMSILVEVRKRLGSEWMMNLMTRGDGEGPRVLDAGAGGAGIVAWEQVLRAQWDTIRDGNYNTVAQLPGKKTVVIGSNQLRQRVSQFLDNTTFLPRLPDYIHSKTDVSLLDKGELPQPRKSFDIIIASHLILPLKREWQRKELLDNLWEMLSPEGGVLIFLEKGHPRGFEAVADVRSRLLNEFIVSPTSDPQLEQNETEEKRVREQGKIIAPCTNHKECPMYLTPGLRVGRKDFCHFNQRFIRPPFLQKILGATHENHEDINFSFIAMQRGNPLNMEKDSAPTTLQSNDIVKRAFSGYEAAAETPDHLLLPRNILPPLKRRGHVTLDVCTPGGNIERWTIPKSFSRQAYHDARKAKWGDLWALGAKTRVARPVRLGRGGGAPDDGGVRAREAAKGNKNRVFNLNADSRGIYSAKENVGRHAPAERRTKGGKKPKKKDLLKELL